MFAIGSFFISTAMAAEEAVPVQLVGEPSVWVKFLPLFLIFIVFYFLLIRPQQKQIAAQEALLKGIKKGDKVVACGGLIGTVSKIEDDQHVVLEVAKDVQVKILRAAISNLLQDPK